MDAIRHPHAEIIQGIGGKMVRDQFGLSLQRLHAWRTRGIPYSHRAAIAHIADEMGISTPDDFLDPPSAQPHPKPDRSAA